MTDQETEYSKHEPEVTTTADTKLVDIVDVMIDKRVHRIGITDQNVIQRLITQSGIISFLYDHLSELQNPDFDRSIEYLHLGSSPVICVSENLPVEEAFRTLREKKVSAVGVTDEYGVLVGSISGSQLKGIDEFSIGDLKLSVKDFLLRRGVSFAFFFFFYLLQHEGSLL
jgi:CBS domain-containing protein